MANSKYNPNYHPAAAREACAVRGLIDTELAEYFGISVSLLYVWQNRYPELKVAMQEGKRKANELVEGVLFKKACGYSYDTVEVTKEPRLNPETNRTRMVIVETKHKTVHVAPDTTAIIFWLKNREPERWRDAKDINISSHEASLEELD